MVSRSAALCIGLLALTLASGCARLGPRGLSTVAAVGGQQSAGTFQTVVPLPMQLNHLLYLPQGYETSDQAWPLVIFLHGLGERGNDVEALKRHGPPRLIAEGHQYPCIIVSPQCPGDEWWSNRAPIAALGDLIAALRAQYRIDPDRIYLTGLSMGGFGTWRLASEQPDLFAAIAPICGGCEPGQAPAIAAQIKHLPIWTFHGAVDSVVPLARTQEIVDALKAAGAPNVQFTVYPGVDHDSWTQTYADPKFWDWLLAQRKK